MKYSMMIVVVVMLLMVLAIQVNAASAYGRTETEWANTLSGFGFRSAAARAVIADALHNASFLSNLKLLVETNLQTKRIQANYVFAYGPDPYKDAMTQGMIAFRSDLGIWPSAYKGPSQ